MFGRQQENINHSSIVPSLITIDPFAAAERKALLTVLRIYDLKTEICFLTQLTYFFGGGAVFRNVGDKKWSAV
jgi:hypothetical protein